MTEEIEETVPVLPTPCAWCAETGQVPIDFDGNTKTCTVCGGLGEL